MITIKKPRHIMTITISGCMKNLLLLFMISLFSSTLLADAFSVETLQGSTRMTLVNQEWEYLQKNVPFSKACKMTEAVWQKVNLPHTWNAFDATDNDPGYRRDAGWYRKQIFISDTHEALNYRLYFEGVNISCDVFINGKKAGSHIGGYLGFTVDMTPFINKGCMNSIYVRADNSINPNIIPSQKSDFFIYGGITRDVWLQVLPKAFIDRVYIQTPKVSKSKAQTRVTLVLMNSGKRAKIKANLCLKSPEGKQVIAKTINKTMPTGRTALNINLPDLKNPLLWSPAYPNLYTLYVRVKDGQQEDSITEKIGYRWFEFKDYGPFYLNGERLLLRGTHRHEEHAGYGAAMPDSLHRRDMKMIKEMGANFVRLAHYPQDPEVYRACDELGLIVWDELPWCRGGMGGQEWQANTKRLLSEQILQNENHPSIIFWSLGNELNWLPDFPGGDDPDSLNAFLRELNDLAHRLDPTRLTAMRKYYAGADITDVFSPSIWAGWYSGVYKSYEKALENAHKKFKHFIHVEYGGASHVGRHTENPISGEGLIKDDAWSEQPNMINVKKISSEADWSENYIVDLFDWHLMVSEQLDWFAGNAQWAFKDFATPLRPENAIPYMNQKGLVDRAGKPKDAFYVFKSYWTTEPKFCYIESHTWTERNGPAGEKRQVCVYSNCEQVELILNGKHLDRKSRNIKDFPASGFHWDVLFKKGQNKLIAIGYANEKKVTRDSLSVSYAYKKSGRPEKLLLSSLALPNDHMLIQARVVDKNNMLCLDFNKRVYFDLNGAGKLLQHYGTPTRSNVIEFANGKAAIEYVPADSGQAVIEARTQDFKGSYLFIDCSKIH